MKIMQFVAHAQQDEEEIDLQLCCKQENMDNRVGL